MAKTYVSYLIVAGLAYGIYSFLRSESAIKPLYNWSLSREEDFRFLRVLLARNTVDSVLLWYNVCVRMMCRLGHLLWLLSCTSRRQHHNNDGHCYDI